MTGGGRGLEADDVVGNFLTSFERSGGGERGFFGSISLSQIRVCCEVSGYSFNSNKTPVDPI
jgi:hypothetical protein